MSSHSTTSKKPKAACQKLNGRHAGAGVHLCPLFRRELTRMLPKRFRRLTGLELGRRFGAGLGLGRGLGLGLMQDHDEALVVETRRKQPAPRLDNESLI